MSNVVPFVLAAVGCEEREANVLPLSVWGARTEDYVCCDTRGSSAHVRHPAQTLELNIPTHQSVHVLQYKSGEVVKADVIMLTVVIGNLLKVASGPAAGIISPMSDPLDRFRKKIKEKGGKSCLYSNHTHLGSHWPTAVGLYFSNITSVLSLDSISFWPVLYSWLAGMNFQTSFPVI